MDLPYIEVRATGVNPEQRETITCSAGSNVASDEDLARAIRDVLLASPDMASAYAVRFARVETEILSANA